MPCSNNSNGINNYCYIQSRINKNEKKMQISLNVNITNSGQNRLTKTTNINQTTTM